MKWDPKRRNTAELNRDLNNLDRATDRVREKFKRRMTPANLRSIRDRLDWARGELAACHKAFRTIAEEEPEP